MIDADVDVAAEAAVAPSSVDPEGSLQGDKGPQSAAAPQAATPAAGGVVGSIVHAVPQPGVVEVRIVLDGCVFVGHLQETGRLEVARSRVGAAVEPIKQVSPCRLSILLALLYLSHEG